MRKKMKKKMRKTEVKAVKVEYPKAKEFYRYFNAIKRVVTDVNANFRSDALVSTGCRQFEGGLCPDAGSKRGVCVV